MARFAPARRSLARRLAAAMVAVAGLAAVPAAPAAVPEGFWGMNATSIMARADAPAHFAAIKGAGMSWVRLDAHWHAIEPSAPVDGVHTYTWSRFDTAVRQAAKAGLEVRPMAGYSPAWASVDRHKFGAPANPRNYAAFVKALALRYGPYGDFWQSAGCKTGSCRVRGTAPISHIEVWNEPNFSFFWHQPDPIAYGAVLTATIDALRSTSRLDPVAVAVGGLLPGAATPSKIEAGDFLRRMVAAHPSLRTTLGEIAVHGYNNDTWVVMNQLAAIRATADAAGLGHVPFVLNENGWTTRAGAGFFLIPVDERVRAQKLSNMVGRVDLRRSDLRLAGYAAYSWLTPELDPANGEHWFGVANHDATLKPAAEALRNSIAAVGSERPLGSGASSMYVSSSGG